MDASYEMAYIGIGRNWLMKGDLREGNGELPVGSGPSELL